MALKASIVANDFEQANTMLTGINRLELTQKQQAEWLIAQAQIQQNQNVDVKTISDNLKFESNWSLADSQWATYYTMKAKLYSQQKNYIEADRSLISSRYYQGADKHQQISDQIWDNTVKYNLDELEALNVATNETELEGWVFVATQIKKNANDTAVLNERLKAWFEMNPTHPIVTNTPAALTAVMSQQGNRPNNIALLLPLSGKFGQQGKVIRDGFVYSMTNDESRPVQTQLNVIDTASKDVNSIYQELQQTKADFIVGPLVKGNIEKLQALNETVHIPMLALNFPGSMKNEASICYLTLNPEQEAEQAAAHIYELGYKKPILIVPANKLGSRMQIAFQNKWKSLTNTSVGVGSFNSTSSIQGAVKNALATSPSIDSAYAVANIDELTLIKPYIDVAVSADKPQPKIFASSRSNSGTQEAFQDLANVSYSDIPMIVNPDPSFNAEYQTLWPNSSNGQKRLHALGMDSYTLISKLPLMKASDTLTVNGKTGQLSLGTNCIVHRELSWGEFKGASVEKPKAEEDEDGTTTDEVEEASDSSLDESSNITPDTSDVEPKLDEI